MQFQWKLVSYTKDKKWALMIGRYVATIIIEKVKTPYKYKDREYWYSIYIDDTLDNIGNGRACTLSAAKKEVETRISKLLKLEKVK